MDALYDLRDMLCAQLEDYGKKGELSPAILERVDVLAHAAKNLDKIIEVKEIEEYGDGVSRAGDDYGVMSRRGRSYARGRGRNVKRDAMGRYSYGDDVHEVAEELRELAHRLPEEHRRKIERAIDELR